MSTVTDITDLLIEMKVRDGKILPGISGLATKLHFILAQQVFLRQKGLVPTHPGGRAVQCDKGLCFAMVTALIIQQCGPAEFITDDLPDGVCGCPYYHENEEIEEVNGLIEETLRPRARRDMLMALLKDLFELEFVLGGEGMRSTIYNVRKREFDAGQIMLPCPLIGDNRPREEAARSADAPTPTREGRKRTVAEETTTQVERAPPTTPVMRSQRYVPATRARPWSEVIAAPHVKDLSPLETEMQKRKAHVERLAQLLAQEKQRYSAVKRESELERENAELARQTADLEKQLAEMRSLMSKERPSAQRPQMEARPRSVVEAKPVPKKPAAKQDSSEKKGSVVVKHGSSEDGVSEKSDKTPVAASPVSDDKKDDE